MKFLRWSHQSNTPFRGVFLDGSSHEAQALQAAHPSPEATPETVGASAVGNLVSQIGNRVEANAEGQPLMDGQQTGGSGISVADSVENFDNRIEEIVNQGTDSTISSALGGSYFSRITTPPEFKGYFNLYLLNPVFLAPAAFTPASIIANQISEGFSNIGDPAELFGDSGLVSIKMAQAVASKKTINAGIEGMKSGGGHLKDMSLTGLQILETINQDSFSMVKTTNEDRAVEFFAKSGRNLETGERDEETGAVWWKRAARRMLFQNTLYRRRYRLAQARYKEGFDETQSNLRSLRRSKEEAIFGVQQAVDRFVLPKQAEGSADTVALNAGRKLVHQVIHDPQAFLKSSHSFSVDGVSAKDIFGTNFNAIDVLEALRAPKYEFLTIRASTNNYLESAITTNEWGFSHYNALRTMKGLDTRVKALQGFKNANLERLESYINSRYDPDGSEIDLSNPQALVQNIITAVGSAAPKLLIELNDVIKNGDPYLGATELFWHLVDFFGRDQNLGAFKKLPPALQSQFAQYFLAKREQLEKSTVSGSITERGSLPWRLEIMRHSLLLNDNVNGLADVLPNLGRLMTSTDEDMAQGALRKFKGITDNFRLLINLLGLQVTRNDDGTVDYSSVAEPDESLLADLPEYERGLVRNILALAPYIQDVNRSYVQLNEERTRFEALVDQDKDKVRDLIAEYEELKNELLNDPSTGLAPNQQIIDFNQGAESAGPGGGGNIETRFTAIRVRQKEIQDLLYGTSATEDGGAVGKLKKLAAFTYNGLPGDLEVPLKRVTRVIETATGRRLRELGFDRNSDISEIINDTNKIPFNVLARNEMWKEASEDISASAEALLGNDTLQQYENMRKTQYVGLDTITYAETTYQPRLTVAALANRKSLHNALFVREDEGALFYHTAEAVIRITKPQMGSNGDQRNMAIWYKSRDERGLDKAFTIPQTNPDKLAVMLSANPENSAADNNKLYGTTRAKIKTAERTWAQPVVDKNNEQTA